MLAQLFRRDLFIRACGVALAAVGAACFRALFAGRIATDGATGLITAATGFLGCSAGATLTALGAHIHDLIPIPRPWGAQTKTRRNPGR